MLDRFSRTQLVFGKEAMDRLKGSHVAVFGVGGVGGYTVEALARSGVGAIDIIDNDKVCLTNINRQIIATTKTVGKYKVDVAKERIEEINPDCKVAAFRTFYMPETADQFDFTQYDYVVDAIDTVTGKIALIENAKKACENAGVAPLVLPIRGGTDGCQLSFMGLPCPNLGTGGHAFHGPYEHITAEGMDKAVDIAVELVKLYAEM